jgi:hypothetical protein
MKDRIKSMMSHGVAGLEMINNGITAYSVKRVNWVEL